MPTITPCQHPMGGFKAQFINPALESPNNLGFHSLIAEAVTEVASGAAEDTEVKVMVKYMVMNVVAQEDVLEGDMVETHINMRAGTKHS